MTETALLDDGFAVSGQIGPGDIARLAAEGTRAIICNRPDGEAPDQPDFAAVAAAARAAGIEARHIPVAPSGATPEAVGAMRAALAELPRPILAYCRSGARSRALAAAAA